MLSALISLYVTVDDGHDYNSIYLRAGNSRVSKLDCLYHHFKCPPSGIVTRHALAHAYGDMTWETILGDYDNIPNLLQNKTDLQVWHRRDPKEFTHRFNEYNKNDTQKAYPHFTNRSITAASGKCVEYDVDKEVESSKVGEISASKFKYRNQTFSDTIKIPELALGNEGTTYIYRGKAPTGAASDPRVVCGDRCMYMWVFRNKRNPKIYQCPITVGNVRNAEHLEHNVPDGVARLVAVSIALQGQFRWNSKKDRDFEQFQWYANG
ncbi:MAG: hypothetical protein Q9187_007063 [Circinaria calcarea]